MAFLRSMSTTPLGAEVTGRLVYARPPALSDFAQWSALRAASAAFLKPWEPTWPADDLTRSAFRHRIKRYQRDIREDQSYPFFVFRHDDDQLVGGLTLSNVRRGVAQTASLGYWIGRPHARNGYMTDAVNQVVSHAFEAIALHRIEAACLPDNVPSVRLLERCGFTEEGFARRYLKINGQWRDHRLFAILAGDRQR